MKKFYCRTACICFTLALMTHISATNAISAQTKTIRGELGFGYSGAGATSVTDASGRAVYVPNSSEDGQLIQSICERQMQPCEVTYTVDKKGNVKVLKVTKLDKLP